MNNFRQKRFDLYILVSIFVLLLQTLFSVDCAAQRADVLTQWLKTHKPSEFTGQVWARVQVVEPQNYFYGVIIDSETNPYLPERTATGTLLKSGLKPKNPADTGNDWGKPLAWYPPTNESDWIKSGDYSEWVKLPVSTAAQWHTAFIVKPKVETEQNPVTLKVEFASQPDANSIFHTVEEKTDDKLVLVVKMPTSGGIEGLKMLQSITEWSAARRDLTKSLQLSPPPHLSKLKIGTWADFNNYRAGGGKITSSRAENDFQNFENLGINSVTSISGLDDNLFSEMSKKYGVTHTTLTAWAGNWVYGDRASGQYDYLPNETLEQHWARVFDDYYPKQAVGFQKNSPFAWSIADHINLGDEISAAIGPEQISKSPEVLKYFRDWLRQQNVMPQMLGAANWEAVQPTDDRAKLGTSVEYARLFYYTRQFINYYTVAFYRGATNAVEKNFPHANLIAVNYQAGPMQFGFVGNDNDLNKGQLDIFELGRQRAFKGVMMEDWVDGWDLGIGRENLAAQMMRAAGRKNNLPLAGYLVGGEAIRAEYFGYLMNDIKEVGLYLYGPYSNIGPAWSDNKNALAQTADVSRRVKKYEDIISEAKPRSAKVALLVAATSDVMQINGLYFCPERQNFFVAMQHGYIPVEVVSEQDITQDDLLKNYSALMVSDPQVRNDVQQKIADWVKNGGHLWASVNALNWDEFNQPSHVLDKVFGVNERKVAFQKDGLKPSQDAWANTVSKFNYQQMDTLKTDADYFGKQTQVPVFGAKLQSSPTTAKVIGSYGDGSPAVFLNKYGKGDAILFGALIGEAYVNQHYPQNLLKDNVLQTDWKFELGAETADLLRDFVTRSNIETPLLISTPGIYTTIMDTSAETLIFFNNATDHPLPKINVRLRHAGQIKSLSSTVSDKIDFQIEKDDLTFEMPLNNADIVCIKH